MQNAERWTSFRAYSFLCRLKDDELKPALFLLLFGVLCDFDCFIGVHRATMHNIFIIFIPLLILAILKCLKNMLLLFFFLRVRIKT